MSKNKNDFKSEFDELIKDLDVLNSNNWPDNVDILYGDDCVRRLVTRFHLDEKTTIRGFRESKGRYKRFLTNKLSTSSFDCSQNNSNFFLWMWEIIQCNKNIITSKRNALTTGHISSLVFINCIGPPIQLFKLDRNTSKAG